MRIEAQNPAHFVVVEGADHRRGEAERDGLQHDIFGGVSCLQVHKAAASLSVFDRRAFKDGRDAKAQRRGCDPILAVCRSNEGLAARSGDPSRKLVAIGYVAIDASR
jgi:hypothetical protein